MASTEAQSTPAHQARDRQYHDTSSAYVLPNEYVAAIHRTSKRSQPCRNNRIHSAVEHDRLDAQAAAIVEMIGGIPCLAPIDSLKHASKAVDVGCGTGVATVQIAGMLPSTRVYGLDISPVPEGTRKIAPKNVTWAVGNVLDVDFDRSGANSEPTDGPKRGDDTKRGGKIKPRDDFTSAADSKPENDGMTREIFTPSGLDYIFGRMLFLGISDWSRYFSVAAWSLKSGGIIEHQDLDWKFYRVGTTECLCDNWPWHQAVVSAVEESGLSTRAGSDAAKLMRDSGLEILSVQTFEFSFVPSSKTPNSQAMGRYVGAKLLPQYPELLRKMLGSQAMNGEELERLTKESLRDITCEEGVHQKYTVTVARKP